jgi:hypothetical protein
MKRYFRRHNDFFVLVLQVFGLVLTMAGATALYNGANAGLGVLMLLGVPMLYLLLFVGLQQDVLFPWQKERCDPPL